MHLKKHLLFIVIILCVLGAIYFYALSDMFHPKQIASYENFTEMSEEFDASKEPIGKRTGTRYKRLRKNSG